MAYLEVLNGPEVGQKVLLMVETFFIGREPTNHLILSDRTVSRRHVVINNMEGRFLISDLKSLKGLLVNGAKATEAALEDGDEIVLGAVRLRFYSEGSARDIPLPGTNGRWLRKIGLGLGAVAAIIGLTFFASKIFLPKPDRTLGQIPAEEIERHYRLGVEWFNMQKEGGRAKKEWEKVLQLDPEKRSVYAKKASRLLETLGGSSADN